MRGIAHISFQGGGLIVPAHTPYERQLLFEHIELVTKRRGAARLSLNGRLWTICLNAGAQEVCAACPRLLDNLTYQFDGLTCCVRCARQALR